jgi:hypothetical protein
LLRPCPRPRFRRERLTLPDGDFLDLDWIDGGQGPTVMIVHGLEGSSDSCYARGLMRQVQRRGWRGVVMHFRNCSGEPNHQLKSYCAGETEDIEYAAVHARKSGGGAPLIVVGYSLGGNALLFWLGTRGTRAKIDAAVAVSVPFLLREAAWRLGRGVSRLYQSKLLRELKRSYGRKFQSREDAPVPLHALAEIRDFFSYDETITAPLHGYQSAEDYYRRASCRRLLRDITMPTLILHARDDPFMTAAVIPGPSDLSAQVRLEISRHGGHVGFVGGAPWKPRYWLEERIPEFIDEQFAAATKPRLNRLTSGPPDRYCDVPRNHRD